MSTETLIPDVAIVLIVAATVFLVVADGLASTFEGTSSDHAMLLGPKPSWVSRFRRMVDHMLYGFVVVLAMLLLMFWPGQASL